MKLVVSSPAHCPEAEQIVPHHALPEGRCGFRQAGHASRNEAAWPDVGVQRELDWNHQEHNNNLPIYTGNILNNPSKSTSNLA